jgi:hypothetical protein
MTAKDMRFHAGLVECGLSPASLLAQLVAVADASSTASANGLLQAPDALPHVLDFVPVVPERVLQGRLIKVHLLLLIAGACASMR